MHNYLDKPISPLTISEDTRVTDLIEGMKGTAFQGKNLSQASDIWVNMLKDTTTVFMGLAGAMVPAGMRKIISFLIDHRMIDCLVSTGANLFHDCHESLGMCHFQGTNEVDDIKLFEHGIDRIYDVFAREDEFRKTDDFIENWVVTLEQDRFFTTREFFYYLGQELSKVAKTEGILTTAYRKGVPIYCPALGDSSIGIAIATGRYRGTNAIRFDIIQDILEMAEIVYKSKTTGVIYIGGGVPKNFIQQTEVTSSFLYNYSSVGHKYAIQITTDAPHWGGLSGCTFEEGQSWGKVAKEAQRVSVYADATIALPLLATATAERVKDILETRKPPKFYMDQSLKLSY
jgi:deoxyhypusine synthase